MISLTTEMIMLLWNLAMWISGMGTLIETSNALSVICSLWLRYVNPARHLSTGWFLGIITAQIYLGLSCIQILNSFVCFFWALHSYLSSTREAKPGNADAWETHWHNCKYKPENSTLHPHGGVCTEHQLFQEDMFWIAQAEWSRAQL